MKTDREIILAEVERLMEENVYRFKGDLIEPQSAFARDAILMRLRDFIKSMPERGIVLTGSVYKNRDNDMQILAVKGDKDKLNRGDDIRMVVEKLD